MLDARYALIDASETQLPGIQAIFNQAVRETFSIWSETETTIEQRRMWLHSRRDAGFPVLAAVDPKEPANVLGYGSFGVFRDFPGYVKTVEHSVYVAPSAQRRGLGRAMVSRLIDEARVRKLERMVGGIDSSNAGSLAMHEGLGFERQGCLKGVGRKFGKSLDLIFVVKTL